jgi:AcrR family transcriptional regulator
MIDPDAPSGTPEERLIVAATRLFASRGIGAVPVDAITRQAQVTTPTLYRQFGGKYDLAAATLTRWSQAHLREMRAALQSARAPQQRLDPQQRLERLFRFLTTWSKEPSFRGSYATNSAAELPALLADAENDEQRAALEKVRKAIADHREAERALLVELASSAGASHPEQLADQLHVVLDGAIAVATLTTPNRRRAVVKNASAIALALLAQATAVAPPSEPSQGNSRP